MRGMGMSYKPHQIETARKAQTILEDRGIVMIAGEPRTGKTRTALNMVSHMPGLKVLCLTKKNAIPGWESEMEATGVRITVTNYEQAHKLSPHDYGLIIIDESHNLNKVGRSTQRFERIRALAYNRPVILLTGTPAVEKLAGLYYQLGVTRHSPFEHFRNFYQFFREYGIPHTIRIRDKDIEQYDRVRPELMQAVEPYMVRLTQKDAGISIEVEDKVHVIELSGDTKGFIHQIMADNVIHIVHNEDNELMTFAFESDMGVRSAVHQAEAGAVLLDEEIVELPNMEMVDYIARNFGNHPGVAVMAHYRSTRAKIRTHLPHVTVLSSDGHAEGVDLSKYEHFVVANSAYSGAKFVQRRERGVNMNRKDNPVVHHLVTDAGISQDVYNAVSQKRDYNIRMFRNERARNTTNNTPMVS